MKTLSFLVAFYCFTMPAAYAEAISEEWVVAWSADLDFFQQTLPETHAELFHTLPKQDFNSAIEALQVQLPELSHHEIIVELAAIVASVNDGHTRLTLPMVEGSALTTGHSTTPPPNDPAMLFNHYPIRLYIYSDGLYVRSIGAENAAYAGAKVIQIGQVSASDAMAAVSRVVHRDNDMQLKHLIPSSLVIPEVLSALHINNSPDQGVYLLETSDGKQHKLVLSPVAEGASISWFDAGNQAPNQGGPQPLYLRNMESNFWFEHLKDQQTVYWQYNEVSDTAEESIATYAVRLTDYIAQHGVQKLIIDLRFNSGGDNSLNRSLLHALIRAPALREPGSLFVITGRGTFSAAMMFAIDLEKHTNAIFVGEPTGAALNHYGDSRKVQLPNSGVTIRISTLYWQYAGPKDERLTLKPHIPAKLSSQDYRSGSDPAMNAILALSEYQLSDTAPIGNWTSRVLGYNSVINVSESPQGWTADIDFVDLGANDLPLTQVSYQDPMLRFDFPNGDQVIEFEGRLQGNMIIGKAVARGQTFPWVALRE